MTHAFKAALTLAEVSLLIGRVSLTRAPARLDMFRLVLLVRGHARFDERLLTLLCVLLAGCSPPVVSKPLPSAIVARESEALDPKLVEAATSGGQLAPSEPEDKDGAPYKVGPGDSLLVAVYGHPELAIAQYAGNSSTLTSNRASGLTIDNDGTIQFPLIGSVKVAGKTTAELRDYLENELSKFVKDPKVTVQIAVNGSIRYYLVGQFTAPGLKYSDRPLRLLEAISLGGSVALDKANLHGAYVARGARRLPINFNRLLREGDLTQNVKLRSGDIVFVPDDSGEVAFVFGGVSGSNVRGGVVPFVNGRLDILQALAHAGFGFRERALGKLSKTRVIRSDGDRGEYFIVDVSQILKGDAALFFLMPGDVVYVPATAVANWNQALEQLLPTLQTISGLLTPYVQIKYLERN